MLTHDYIVCQVLCNTVYTKDTRSTNATRVQIYADKSIENA